MELIAAVGIVVFWGDIWHGKQVILLGTDNRNTFSWLDNKTAKKGLALRITATFHVWCVKNGIEVYPFYLRSLHNIRPDFISRESKHDIDCWATAAGYTQVEKQWRWKSFLACAPKLDCLEDRVVNLPKEMSFDTIGKIGKVAEWRPMSGIALQIFDRLNLDYHAIGGLELFKYYQDESVVDWKLIFGSARHQGEIEEFRQFWQKRKWKLRRRPLRVKLKMACGIWATSGLRIGSVTVQNMVIAWWDRGTSMWRANIPTIV